jgi:hypothetical protein
MTLPWIASNGVCLKLTNNSANTYPTSLTTSFSLPRAREARAATRPIPPELQPASSSRRSVSAVAPAAALSFRPEPDSAKKNWRRRSAAAARRRRRVRVGLLRSSVSVRLRAL